MKRVLFICSGNRLRSPTAEQVFASWPDVETDSAGLSADAVVVVSSEQIEWADIVVLMEKAHLRKLRARYRKFLNGKRAVSLDIPDEFAYMDPALQRLLVARAGPYFK